MTRGKFIVLEGIDGVGKTTVATLVTDSLREQGYMVFRTNQPSAGPIGTFIRQILTGATIIDSPRKAYIMSMLFEADRLEHVQTRILPMLEKGVTVICDRYSLSGMVYQTTACREELAAKFDKIASCSALRGAELEDRRELTLQAGAKRFQAWLEGVSYHAPEPDVTLLLHAPLEVVRARLTARGTKATLYEREGFLESVHALYADSTAKPIVRVDADRSVLDVTAECLKIIRQIIAEGS